LQTWSCFDDYQIYYMPFMLALLGCTFVDCTSYDVPCTLCVKFELQRIFGYLLYLCFQMRPYMLVVSMRKCLILFYGNYFFKLDLSVSNTSTFLVKLFDDEFFEFRSKLTLMTTENIVNIRSRI